MTSTAALECPHMPFADPAWCKLCTEGPKLQQAPVPTGVTKSAIYTTANCKSCAETIHVGTEVERWSDSSWRHHICP